MHAILIDKGEKTNTVEYKEIQSPSLSDNHVRVEVHYSSMNYKDALVLTGAPGIVRQFPMVAGIDLAGQVAESRSPDFNVGDLVVGTGWGLSEEHWGGYAEQVCLPSHFLCRLPEGRDARWAMQLGTAGLTAMMAILRLEKDGALALDAPAIVTGAGGGVGGVALIILSAKGHEVYALSGRSELDGYLRQLGAHKVIGREDARAARQPIDKPCWSAIVDNVGGDILAGLLRQLHYNGAAALCGLAASPEYSATVVPFILRGISMYGIESVQCPIGQRIEIWKRLDELVNDTKLESLTAETISLEQAISYAPKLLAGKIQGRLLVKPS